MAKLQTKNEKRPLPVDVRRSKTLLLKLPNDDDDDDDDDDDGGGGGGDDDPMSDITYSN